MGKCEYSQYRDGSDRCVIKGSMKGMDSDKVSSDTYREYCRYESGYKKCPFYNALPRLSWIVSTPVMMRKMFTMPFIRR